MYFFATFLSRTIVLAFFMLVEESGLVYSQKNRETKASKRIQFLFCNRKTTKLIVLVS